jgi:hypothetical protein
VSGEPGAASGPPQPISTRAELDARIAERAKPELQAHLTPGGWDETQTHRKVREDGERRIAELRERMESARTGLENAYAFKSREGQARADFSRER